MQGSFSPGLSFLPVPSALLIFAGEGGGRLAFPVGWMGVVCGSPSVLNVWLYTKAIKRGQLRVGSLFAVELPAEKTIRPSSDGQRSGRPEEEFACRQAPPAVAEAGTGAGLSVRIECRCCSLRMRFDQYRLRGEILAICLDGRRQEMTAALDLSRLLPLHILNLHRYGGGTALGALLTKK